MAATPYDSDDNWDDSEELDLAEDESLPWLEATDDEEPRGGFDTGRIVLVGVLALLALAVVVGGIWYFARATSDEPPADGSLIAAPEEPYKTKPENEGGKVFPGTGDSSFAVGEGETREGRLADSPQQAQAEREGLDRVFREAGFEWREPGCSMCLAMNADRLEPGERCASTSNRNFEGRQGAGGRTHLVSPAMAAAAAIAGCFVDVRKMR